MTDIRIIKLRVECPSCDNIYILAWNETLKDNPTYCSFCGEILELLSEDEDSEE